MKKENIKDGVISLIFSLLPIIIGPVIIQIGYSKYQVYLNIYTLIGVLFCIIAIFLIFSGIFKIINALFEKWFIILLQYNMFVNYNLRLL